MPAKKPRRLQSCVQDTLYGMRATQTTLVLGLPFLIAHFGIHGLHQFRAFQKMVCNNQEPTRKREKKVWLLKNTVKQTWPHQLDGQILYIRALLSIEFLTMFEEVPRLFSISS